MDPEIEIEKADSIHESDAVKDSSIMTILYNNRVLVGVVVVMLIIVVVLYMRKDRYINQPIRSDTQSDFSIESELKKFINRQERLIQQYRQS